MNKIYSYITLIYVLCSLIIEFHKNNSFEKIVLVCTLYFIYVIVIISTLYYIKHHRYELENKKHQLNVKQSELDKINSELIKIVGNFNYLDVITKMFVHDFNNLLSFIVLAQSELKKDNVEKVRELLNHFIERCNDKVGILSLDKEENEIKLNTLLVHLVYSMGMQDYVHIKGYCLRKFNPRVLSTIFYNLISNSKEAYERKHGNIRDLMIEIFINDTSISLVDNSGGFDVNKINYGRTEKHDTDKKHGVFLKTLLDKQDLFNIKILIESNSQGTTILISYK